MTELMRACLAQAVLFGCQCILYFGVEKFEGTPHNVATAADKRIPFLPWTVFIYILWFPLIALFPIALYCTDPAVYGRYISAILADIVISLICYLAYPTTFRRPVPPDTFCGRLMQIVYSGSYKGVNCAPSMHCSMCYLVIIAAVLCPGLPAAVFGAAVLVAAGIVISTMTTKQHVLIDAVSALILAFLCWGIGTCLPAVPLVQWIRG